MKLIIVGVQILVIILAVYWVIVSLWGLRKPNKTEFKQPEKRFLILIPAHNEENVISELLKNLKKLNYPSQLFDIMVIADNCTDNTVKLAEQQNVKYIIHNSKPNEVKGKPYAIKYALNYLGNNLDKFDGIIFFDADNLVASNFLNEMNNHMLNGERVIQGYLDSKNANDNFISLGYAASYYYMNRSWQLSKYRIGLSNILGGTGFCVETKLLQEIGWSATSLTEDLEFSMQCILKNIRVTWAHNAKIYDEKPLKMKTTLVQRVRWLRGHWDVCFKYAPKLFKNFIMKFDLISLDAFLYLVHPGRILVTAGLPFFTMLSLINIFYKIPYIFVWQVWIPFIIYNLVYMLITFYDSDEKIKGMKAFLSLIAVNYATIPLFFYSIFTVKNKTWIRTEHTRNIKDVKK